MYTESTRARSTLFTCAAILSLLTFRAAEAGTPLNIANVPLFVTDAVPPLNMLVVGRDHKLYYEAYNDASDLNGDGKLDIGFKPTLTYFGYFDPAKCYTHDGSKFVPNSAASTLNTCTSKWSGNWLNYVTTARIDALRKVLYGGFRRTDTGSQTVLERSHIPHDAHSWVKEYRGTTTDGYDIAQYTPLSQPTSGKTHLFASVTLMLSSDWTGNGPSASNNPPLLRVAENVAGPNNRAWHWASTESPVAGACYGRDGGNDGQCKDHGGSGLQIASNTSTFTDYIVRVEVCKAGLLEDNCRKYPSGNSKPVGLLQDYGETDVMKFGLLSGSYQKSKSGGVLRKAVAGLTDEINTTTDGTFKDFNGIIATLDKLRAVGYTNYRDLSWYGQAGRGAGVQYRTSIPSGDGLVSTSPFNEPEFGGMWGNPIAEMMYEALRYYSGASGPTGAFDYSGSSFDASLGLPKVDSWTSPYASGSASCAKPFMTVISDINPSYDTDQLPGTSFTGSPPADNLGGLNVSTEATTIWNQEMGGSKNVFIGESGAIQDGAPSAKAATSFSNIRGLAPEEPTKQGGYYAASVAKYGHDHDINSSATGSQKVQTFAVALASPLPRIEIPVNGTKVTLVPFAKSVGGYGIEKDLGKFQPTNQIVDYYVESLAADGTSGSFLINFEDVESGNDHDMDAVVRYQFAVESGQVRVTVDRLYEQGGVTHHMGYVVSGTTENGIYLVVQDDTSDTKYFLDTPAGKNPDDCRTSLCTTRPASPQALPWSDTRLFTPGSGTATLLKDPLWYAAKWGGYKDSNSNNLPDVETEWNEDTAAKDPGHTPDNYFLVTNALTLKQQLSEAFDTILKRTAASSSAAVNSGTISTDTRIYQAQFSTGDWSGDVVAFPVSTDDPATPNVNEAGKIGAPVWRARSKVPAASARKIFTVNTNRTAVPFEWGSLDATRQGLLQPLADGLGEKRVTYLRGDRTFEQSNGGVFRNRNSASVLGDFVSSSPVYVGAPRAPYTDAIASVKYSAFKIAQKTRQKVVYAGANEGMLHAFEAETGKEMWAYIPGPVFRNLHELTKPGYQHRFFVDGAFNVVDAVVNGAWKTVLAGGLNNGGQGIYALDVTNPVAASATAAGNFLMWEYTDADDADLGYTYSRPAIVKMRDGKWYAMFGNGYNNTVTDSFVSTTGNAVLYLVRLEDKVTYKFDTGVGMTADPLSQSRPNGMSSPAVVDIDDDGIADVAYAGDLFGNVWKFRFTTTAASGWGFAYKTSDAKPAPLFVAKNDANARQSITTRPQVGFGPRGEGLMVLFGTGKFLEPTDRIVAQVKTQSFYGVWDRNLSAETATFVTGSKVSRTDLTEQTVDLENSVTVDGVTTKTRVSSRGALGDGKLGWFMDLPTQGEMQVTNAALRNRRVIFTSQIPSEDPCAAGGTSWLTELDYITGSCLDEAAFDLNNDGKFTDRDSFTVTVNNREVTTPACAVRSENGIWSQPSFLTSNGDEFLYLSNSNNDDRGDEGGSPPGDCNKGTLECKPNGVPANAYGRQSWRQAK